MKAGSPADGMEFMRLEWYIARRYLSSRRGARFLSLITMIAMGGVFVGVMALIVVTSVMSGLQRDLRDKILGTNPHIWLTTYGDAMQLEAWEGTLARIRNVDGVVSAAPFIHTEVGLGNLGGHAEAAILRGIYPEAEGEPITDIVREIQAGDLQSGTDSVGQPAAAGGRGAGEPLRALPRLGGQCDGAAGDSAHPDGHTAPAHVAFRGGGPLPYRHVRVRQQVHVYDPRGRPGDHRDGRSGHRAGDPCARSDAVGSRGTPCGGRAWRLPLPGRGLEDDELLPLLRAAAGEARDGDHPPPDRGGGRLQHHLHPGDGGDGQDAGDRDPEVDGAESLAGAAGSS